MFKIDRAIDTFNEKFGFYASYLVLPLIIVVVFEVFMRYAFNAPTTWAFELTVFLYGVHFCFALAYAHKHNTHVSIDVFEARLSPKSRAILRIITNAGPLYPLDGPAEFLCVCFSCQLMAAVGACFQFLGTGNLPGKNAHGGRLCPLFSARGCQADPGYPFPERNPLNTCLSLEIRDQ